MAGRTTSPDSRGPREPLAVVGVAGVYPGAVGIPAYWRLLVSGRDAVTEVPPERWRKEDYYAEDARGADKTYSVRGAFLPGVAFDPVAFGIPPALLSATDVTQLLALVVAREALEDATGGDLGRLDREMTSVILGTSQQNELGGMMAARSVRPVWEKAMQEHGLSADAARVIADRISDHFVGWQESTFPGMLANIVAGRVANRFDLGGTNLTVDAACASSLAALGVAADELRLGRATLALTGGVDVTNSATGFICFSQTPALSPSGAIRPFDEAADGTLLGEGVGILAVKRLVDAEEAGDRIYAVIRGIGTSSDGRANSIYAPHAAGQERAFRRAYEEAGVSPGTVELLEAHATATRVGDAVELESSSRVFEGSGRTDRQWCGIGSVKSQIAHTKCAAGVAGLTKVILGLTQRVIPPTVNLERPNPRFDFPQSPFYTPTRARPWFASQDHPRRAAVSAFGFGGTNAHVVVEEYRGPGARHDRIPAFPVHLLAVSGADRPAAAAAARALAEALGAGPDELADLAVASVRGVDPGLPARIAVVAATVDEGRSRLLEAAGRLEAGGDGRGPGSAWGSGGDPGPVAFLFPGQGSQHLDMGIDLAIHFDAAREAFELGNDLVPGTPLHRVIMPLPTFDVATRAEQEARLTATEWAQPAMGATSLALLAVLEQVGLQPDAAAGHSFGEWTALCAAGALTPPDLLRLARIRGEAVRDAAASTDGAMVAVRGTRAQVEGLIEGSPDLVLANLNAPRQQVVAGPRGAVEALEARLGEAGLDFRRLAVATAFHSPLVAAAKGPVAASLAEAAVAPPRIPVYANVTARPHPSAPDDVRALLARQITAPVRFAEIVEALWSDGIRTFVEVGPGQVLTGLVGAGLGDRPHRAVALQRPGGDGITSLFEALAQLFAAGVRLELAGLFRGYGEAVGTPRSTSPVTVILDGSVVGRPWPPPRGEAGPPPVLAPVVPRPMVTPQGAPPVQPIQQESGMAAEPGPHPNPAVAAEGPTPAQTQPHRASLVAHAEAAHNTFQEQLTRAHLAFLELTRDLALGAPGVGEPSRSRHGTRPLAPNGATAPTSLPEPAPAPSSEPAPALPSKQVRPADPVHTPASPGDGGAAARLDPHPAPPPLADPAVPHAPPSAERLLAVVSEKTGYPTDLIDLDMDLEADLGIDSIKRVQILASVLEVDAGALATSGLDDRAVAALAGLRTLREVQARLDAMIREMGSAAAADGGVGPDEGANPEMGPDEGAEPASPAGGSEGRRRGSDADATPGAASLDLLERRLEPLPATGPTMTTGGRVAVLDGGSGWGEAVAAALAARGMVPCALEPGGAAPDAVVFLGGLGHATSYQDSLALHTAALAAAQAVAASFAASGGRFVTVQDTGGDFGRGARRAPGWPGGLPGLVKTMAREWPGVQATALDVAREGVDPREVARRIATEVVAPGESEVAVDGEGRRWAPRLAPVAVLPRSVAMRLGAGDVVVVSGGGRGVTAPCVLNLVRRVPCRLVVLGRTVLAPEPPGCEGIEDELSLRRALVERTRTEGVAPDAVAIAVEASRIRAVRELRRNLARFEAEGAEVWYEPMDVADPDAVAGLLQRVRRRWGPIRGVVHAAGVLADKLLIDKTPAQLADVFRVKVGGLEALLQATGGDPLRFLVLFASIAGVQGSRGQADYAMANELATTLLRAEARRRGSECTTRSLAWGPFNGGMMTPTLQHVHTTQGVGLIPLEVGAAAFIDALEDDHPEVERVLLQPPVVDVGGRGRPPEADAPITPVSAAP